ncbi:MAG: hypothetical protein GWN12_10990 [Thermoplasmata archaeon]|nr:hypothetical protein [Thermoplasmata archaeon]NIS20475.1 hypothetical protein [Thermoplasmata archaeon]NIT77564.1 hypothetical protein [Thermoplasmata archaeon]NIU49564.1 hypothetical protein [Thermoplasmata archaeon]NIW89282.1 hypothetical protein [Thermoplasmata archaeon]
MEGDLAVPVVLIGLGLIGMAVSMEAIQKGRGEAAKGPGTAPWSRSRAAHSLLVCGVGTILVGIIAAALFRELSVPSITFAGIATVILGVDVVLIWYLSGFEGGRDEGGRGPSDKW